ncbi:MAG TPA: DUF4251 domain-containing protein [Draconibacterium sp.]|nr:DUF4251 domain-containing protein [Draconibacterium sp.]
MKKIIIASILIFSIVAVNAQDKKLSRKERKAQRNAMLTEQTTKLVDSKTWQFNADQMIPTGASSRNLTTPYNVVLKDGVVSSYLPYFGRAYTVDYGSTESPLTFDSPIEEYNIKDTKRDGYMIYFTANNKNDKIVFTLHVSSTGSASLSASSTNRQNISFNGDLVPIEEEE